MAGTFQNLTGGRLLLNVVTGGESHEQRMYGDFEDKDARYARCDEFLTVVRALWRGETVDFAGDHLRDEGARLGQIPDPVPAIYFGGSSTAAGQVAARHADVYLTWGERPDAVREKVEWIRALAADEGREVRFGLRVHVITRDTSQEAWVEADRLLAGIDRAGTGRPRRSESEGQQATYTGLLTLFLDRFAGGTGLTGAAVPLVLGAGPAHALAPEVYLRPLLTELGAVVPVRGLYVLDTQYDRPEAYTDWFASAMPMIKNVLTPPILEGVS